MLFIRFGLVMAGCFLSQAPAWGDRDPDELPIPTPLPAEQSSGDEPLPPTPGEPIQPQVADVAGAASFGRLIPSISSVHEFDYPPLANISGMTSRIRAVRFEVDVIGLDPATEYRLLACFDGETIGDSGWFAGCDSYTIPTQIGFPPGRYRLTVQVFRRGAGSAVQTPPMSIDYQPTYLRDKAVGGILAATANTTTGAADTPTNAPNTATNATPHSKPVDAFVLLPLVATLEQAKQITDFCSCGKPDRCPCTVKKYAYDYRFDAAAQFPLPGFGLRGEKQKREGAIIYEGMRFAIREDGRYEVRFVVETPAMPVTMRLQLILEDECTQNRYTLTLPPISIPESYKPQKVSQQSDVQPVYANLQIVHHEGYLPVLAQSLNNIRVVSRTGTARFGFGVAIP